MTRRLPSPPPPPVLPAPLHQRSWPLLTGRGSPGCHGVLLGPGLTPGFDLGLEFQENIRQRFKSPVHHPSPSPEGSFFLLATFRRFLFRLTEDWVGIALQSCLGGRALDFHVQFLSTNHFRFSVFSKDVGFAIYKLRRVITSMFDVYFHLWNNGTPHWEREKRAWEIEQEKEWTKILSKSSKREAKKMEKTQKHVHFAKKIIQSPPKVKFEPHISLAFGSFISRIDPQFSASRKLVFGRHSSRSLASSGSRCDKFPNQQPIITASSTAGSSDPVSNSNSNHTDWVPKCSKCLGLGHSRSACNFPVRCLLCFNSGHLKRHSRSKARLTKVRPVLIWRPKHNLPDP